MRLRLRKGAARSPRGFKFWLPPGVVAFVAAITILELWKGVFGPLQSVRHDVVVALGWLKDHWLNAVAITAIATIASVMTPFALRVLDRRGNVQTSSRLSRERSVMLSRVRYKWINGVLEPSIFGATKLVLRTKTRLDILPPHDRAISYSLQSATILATEDAVAELFKDVGGSILIVGAPGAGKTTLLLTLANGLLVNAGRDDSLAMPVVFNLASWAKRRLSLENWVIGELVASYNVPHSTAAMWISQDSLTLLLDGLDEVAENQQVACVEAINDYRYHHGLVQMVVCGRTQNVEKLAVKLNLDHAVELLPPQDNEIDDYLRYLESRGMPMDDVRGAIAADRDLREMLRSPLMLRVISLAYHSEPAHALAQPGSLAQRQERLWRTYVTGMFELHPLRHYTAEQACSWLAWLASGLASHNLAEFQLDRLTLDWVPGLGQRRLGRVESLLIQVAVNYLNPVEDLHWSWKRMTFNSDRVMGVLASVIIGVVMLPISALSDSSISLTGRALIATVILGVVFGIGLALLATLSLCLSGELREERAVPNEGIRRSARFGAIIGLFAGLLFGTICGLVDRFTFHISSPWLFGFGTGLVTALIVAAITGWGACLVHYIVLWRLVAAGRAPWKFQTFLDSMTERLLLIRSGSGYMFAHQLLRDYFSGEFSARPD